MPSERRVLRCAVYTRKSSEHGLEQDFNSLDAQREAGEAYIKSQSHEGWKLIRTPYADGGLSGATMERPALQRLLVSPARPTTQLCASGDFLKVSHGAASSIHGTSRRARFPTGSG